eukprot:GEMP01061830.1.p1 GENE.GEMP01061830.1~~GEMP01061830.1.p1  ORF type:complete len:202 (+),score=45.71 GEMP01061830.1:31-606(+)
MSGYNHGVLIHNFNEDQFGLDVQKLDRPPLPTPVSVSHAAHGWKQPSTEKGEIPMATQSVAAHILFGHSGDMTDPRTNFQKRDFAPTALYFMQDPAKVKGALRGHLDDDPKKVAAEWSSNIAEATKKRWEGDKEVMRNMYTSSYKDTLCADSESTEQSAARREGVRRPRPKGEFSARTEINPIVRSNTKFY